jgi:hypothetical protein
LGANARHDVLTRFNQDRVVDTWLAWYEEILEARRGGITSGVVVTGSSSA